MMRFFNKGMRRLVIIGMNDLACEAAQFCKNQGIDVRCISAPRFRDLPSLDPAFTLCAERMHSLGVEVEEMTSVPADSVAESGENERAAFSFDSPFIISQEVIDAFNKVVFNEHGAHLPHGKGGGGFSWRILEDDRDGNVLFHLLTVEIDGGPIVYEKPFVFPSDCRKPADFYAYQHQQNVDGLKDFLSLLLANEEFKVREQDSYFESYMPRLNTREQAFIDWSWDVHQIYHFILAFSDPYEGAKSYIGDKLVYIKDAFIDEKAIHTHPFKFGIVFNITNNSLRVTCKNGTLVITEWEAPDGFSVNLGDRLYTTRDLLDSIREERIIYTPKGQNKP